MARVFLIRGAIWLMITNREKASNSFAAASRMARQSLNGESSKFSPYGPIMNVSLVPVQDKTKKPSTLAVLVVICWVWVGCANSDPKSSTVRAGAGQAVPVSVFIAQNRDMPVYLTGLGTVTAYNTVSV